MRNTGALNRRQQLKVHGDRLQLVEQPGAPAKHDRSEIYVYLVEKSRVEALSQRTRGADDDVLIPGDHFGLRDSTFDAVGDKRERRS